MYQADGASSESREDFPCVPHPVMIPGPAGDLEAVLSCPAVANEQVTIICHPHPLHGGTLQNKVVHTIAKALHESGMHTVRFNFRGVGASEGKYDDAVGEVDDLLAVVDWVASRIPAAQIRLAGFSFGAYIALCAEGRREVTQLVTIAPPVNLFDFTTIEQPRCPWVLIQGEQDEIVPAQQVLQWAREFEHVNVVPVQDAGHFFHGRLNDLREIIIAHSVPPGSL